MEKKDKKKTLTISSSLTKKIDLSSFSNGVYIIKLSNELGIINKKIILE